MINICIIGLFLYHDDMKRYENKLFYYIWKPHGIPTTYGPNPCFLDQIRSSEADIKTQLVYTTLSTNHQLDKEFGLINRLDNDTWWLLFFAKNKDILEEYKLLQSRDKVEKIYICDVYGIVDFEKITIDTPIYHHKHDQEKMTTDPVKWRGKGIITTSYVTKLYIDEYDKTSTLLVRLHKWARHQIRIHLASIWHPILWETIYIKSRSLTHKSSNDILHLWSIWLEI